MTSVQLIENQIKKLNKSALAAFRNWFRKYDAVQWDRQIEADARVGKLDKLAKEALSDHRSGKTKRL
jgi:hypothetical protein